MNNAKFKILNEKIRDEVISQNSHDKILSDNHTELLKKATAGEPSARKYVVAQIEKCLMNNKIAIKAELIQDIFSENWGLGLLDKYDTEDIDEIMVEGTKILIQKRGNIIEVPEKFSSEQEVLTIIRRVLAYDNTKDINEANSIIMAQRADGSRITAVVPRVGKMPYLNIRKFDSFLPTTENMIASKTLSSKEVDLLILLEKGRANIMVIGEMGSGKTTFMRWLLGYTPDNLVIGSLETTFELHLDKLYPQKNWIQLEEHLPDYPLQSLFAVMLRQNVDIILVGEARSYEVNELIKAMSRGHSGSTGTCHSISPSEMIDDMADMVLESGKKIDLDALKLRIARAINVVVQFRKLPNKKRICSGIYEIVADNSTYKVVPLFEYDMNDETFNGEHKQKNKISDRLKQKLNAYGVKKSELESW